jgi:hypothetical protein
MFLKAACDTPATTFRSNVQLIDGESGAHLWADRFESHRANVAKAQSEITGRLARTLNLELAEAVGRRLEQDGSIDTDVYDFLMRGWASYYRPASAAVRQEVGEHDRIGLLSARGLFPLVEAVDRHEAAAALERLAKGRPGLDPSALALMLAKPAFARKRVTAVMTMLSI